MSTSPAVAPTAAQADLTLSTKQQSALLVLWPCLKTPPRIDVQIGPRGIRLGATFDRTAAGMAFENVNSSHDQITVAADLDLATVEVDFERLKTAAGLESVEEAAEVWQSIKRVVDSAASVTPVLHQSRNISKSKDKEASRPTLLEQLYTAARDIQLFAYYAQLKEFEARHEPAVETAATNLARSKPHHRYTDKRLQMAMEDVRRVSSVPSMRYTKALTAWVVQGLFGRKGLENFYACQAECSDQQPFKPHMALNAPGQERDPSKTLKERVLDTYQKICDVATTRGCVPAYQDRLRLYVCFYDELTGLRCKFWQKGSAEQRALLAYGEHKDLFAPSERTNAFKARPSLQQVAWAWLMEETGQSRSTIDDAVWKGRQMRTMIELFGEGVLYFMDDHLEIELSKINCSSGIFISVMKTIEVTIGQELRTLCETALKALHDTSQSEMSALINEVRAKHSLTTSSLDSKARIRIDTLLDDISDGRVTLSMELADHDDLYADF